MEKLTLAILAAGLGSRFGGQKQTDDIDGRGHILLDYSLHDACLSGFRRALFIIRKEMKENFLSIISKKRWFNEISVDFVFQELTDLPRGFPFPKNRSKPWGTAHALSCLSGIVDSPFCVINADDFYGRDAISQIASNLKYEVCSMVGYRLHNTLSRFGPVSRGICKSREGYLTEIVERIGILQSDGKITDQDGTELSGDSSTSMNLWGFTPEVADECRRGFSSFLNENRDGDLDKCEYCLPSVVSRLITDKKLKIKLLSTDERWFGLTYKKDKSEVSLALENMTINGIYPSIL
jgi:NDP-sugar pyrophosphorylase family protein